ncbi:MAG: CotH kinase family protein [Bacteroidales bacterium]|nr:CotH kinase family protein [Bacteroidales bacterium]
MCRWLKYIGLKVFLLLVPILGLAQPAEKVCFSVPGGFYEESPTLEMFPFYMNHHIRFTTNGSRPTAQSRLYTEPLLLDGSLYSTSDIYTIQVAPEKDMFYADSVGHCIVIRAAVFDENDNCISEVATNSYFIQSLGCDTHGLPVCSLCADSLDLFGFYRGILVPGSWFYPDLPDWTGNYFNKGPEWEKVCNVEFYEPDNSGINQIAGLRTHGGASRRYQQKGLKVYAREEYGKKRFEHLFFPENAPIDSYKRLCLKPFRCSNWMTTGFQDHLAQQVVRTLDIDGLASRQMVLFLNGEYWGIYALEESPDERYLEDHFGVDTYNSSIIKKWIYPEHGDSIQWQTLFQWVMDADLSVEENYQIFCEQIDVDNFIDYQIFELYSGNVDWPKNNVRCWHRTGGKWRWIFFDGDGCFFRDWDVFANATNTDTIHYGSNPSAFQATLFFRKLFTNDAFKERFLDRFHQVMSDQLQYDQIAPCFNAVCELIRNEVPSQSNRFGFPSSMTQWEEDVAHVDEHLRTLNSAMETKLSCFLNTLETPDPQSSIRCYPNPFGGQLTVEITASSVKPCEIRVSNVLGQEVYCEQILLKAGLNQTTVNLPLNQGLYFLMIDNQVTKIVRQ